MSYYITSTRGRSSKMYVCRVQRFIKVYMNSDTPLEKAAIYFLPNFYLKQGISSEYVIVDFICMGILDLIDKFNDTSRYLDDIFTIDNPEFAEHIPDIYPRELQLNKANTSDKETSFLDLNIKVVGI